MQVLDFWWDREMLLELEWKKDVETNLELIGNSSAGKFLFGQLISNFEQGLVSFLN